MLPAAGLHGPQDSAHDDTADSDEGYHDDEPPDGHGLRHDDATAGLGSLLLVRVHLDSRPGIENKQKGS